MTAVSEETSRAINRGTPAAPWLAAWNVLAAGALALSLCVLILGRTWPIQASLPWLAAFGIALGLALGWLFRFSRQVLSRALPHPISLVAKAEAPLVAVSAAIALAVYLSDSVNHEVSQILYPTPAVALLLLALGTAIAQRAILEGNGSITRASLARAIRAGGRWAIPVCLLLVGLIQDASYLWVIGNDFTRYWAITDGIASASGYIVSVNQGIYIEGGMFRYSIEFPVFPLLLLASFQLVGHDALAAHLPTLVANTLLPLVMYGFYRQVGLARPLAFTAACTLAFFPFLRLYTLNAPVPDAVFMVILTGAGWAFARLVGPIDPEEQSRSATHRSAGTLPWALFGLMAGLTALARAEGLLFVALMFLALLPQLRNPRLYLAGSVFATMVAAFSLVVLSNVGVIWPRNAGSSFELKNVSDNLDWLGWISLPWYADPFGIPAPLFAQLVALLAILALVGTLAIALRRWQIALLPVAAALHTLAVFTIDPKVAGSDQWFDFFRHISYGLPFAALSLLWPAQRTLGALVSMAGFSASPRRVASVGLSVFLMILASYQLWMLASPSLTYGKEGRQLLTSDVWVNLPDIVEHRFPLPELRFTRQEGVMMIDPEFEYVPTHLAKVNSHYEPFSVIRTGEGAHYQLSSLLVMLFGMGLSLVGGSRGSATGRAPGQGQGQ